VRCIGASVDADLEAELVKLPLYRRQAAGKVIPLQRAECWELVSMCDARDGFGVILLAADHQEVVAGGVEAVCLQEARAAQAVALRDSLQHSVGVSQVGERHRISLV